MWESMNIKKPESDVKDFQDEKLIAKLKEYYDTCIQYYGRIHKKMRLLDAVDKGDLWKAVRAKFPPYQMLPDTNLVAYVKDNLLASLYTVAKSAEVVSTTEQDVDFTALCNIALEHEWDRNNVALYQFMAGERAALTNYGITQVYWNEDKKAVGYKNIDPIRFMRDPFADCLDEAGYCVTYNVFHKSFFMNDSRYKKNFLEFLKKQESSTEMPPDYDDRNMVSSSKEHFALFMWWIRTPEGRIDEIHTIDNKFILFMKRGIKPNMFPFAELYCNLPGSSLVGVSGPAKIFANSLVYNLMDSIAFTSVYKNQNPPKFINKQSGLNVSAFSKHGDQANRTFVVNGDASKAVHYHQFPDVSPVLPNMQSVLQSNIQLVSGVDGRYTGRDTGSIITTGGTEEMLNRVTLIDTPKVVNYENYTKRLTELTLSLLIEFCPSRTYLIKDEAASTVENTVFKPIVVDFPHIQPEAAFEYSIQISSELPKNKQRVQAWANNMMEKQMQYQSQGLSVDIITPEEWIRYQDVPYKERLLERMGVQSQLNSITEAEAVVSRYAQMVGQGVSSEDAIQMAAQDVDSLKAGEPLVDNQGMLTEQMPIE
jgi:uncharacterized protein YqcC (DUF446 family)